jgi:phage tail tape-measure protein
MNSKFMSIGNSELQGVTGGLSDQTKKDVTIVAGSAAGGGAIGMAAGTPAGPVGMAVGTAVGTVAGAAAGAVRAWFGHKQDKKHK